MTRRRSSNYLTDDAESLVGVSSLPESVRGAVLDAVGGIVGGAW